MGVNERARVRMTDEEVQAYLAKNLTTVLATIGPGGMIHQVAMYYGMIDGEIAFVTKAKAQKVINARRDPRASCLVETGGGQDYGGLKGVAVAGTLEIDDDHDKMVDVSAQIWVKRHGPVGEQELA